MVVFDTSTLLLLIDPDVLPPTDQATGKPLERCKERIEHLIKELNDSRTRILIPTPVLSEFLVKAGPNKHEFLNEFLGSHSFIVGSFDQRAAIELAMLEDADLKSGKVLDNTTTKAKIKFDRQILAIAKVQGASVIYTDDEKLAKLAKNNGLDVVMTWDIPLPPPKAQHELPLGPSK
jgi:predicted nucleic acid-binding protein